MLIHTLAEHARLWRSEPRATISLSQNVTNGYGPGPRGLGSADAYRLLGERLDLLRAQVRYTAEARWAEVVAEAVQAYSVAGVLAGDPTEAELATRVETARRHLGRRNGATGKRKKEPKTE